jgi:hypothetical protein
MYVCMYVCVYVCMYVCIFWILELGICRSWMSLVVIVCMMPLILAVIIMGGSTILLVARGLGREWHISRVFGWKLL